MGALQKFADGGMPAVDAPPVDVYTANGMPAPSAGSGVPIQAGEAPAPLQGDPNAYNSPYGSLTPNVGNAMDTMIGHMSNMWDQAQGRLRKFDELAPAREAALKQYEQALVDSNKSPYEAFSQGWSSAMLSGHPDVAMSWGMSMQGQQDNANKARAAAIAQTRYGDVTNQQTQNLDIFKDQMGGASSGMMTAMMRAQLNPYINMAGVGLVSKFGPNAGKVVVPTNLEPQYQKLYEKALEMGKELERTNPGSGFHAEDYAREQANTLFQQMYGDRIPAGAAAGKFPGQGKALPAGATPPPGLGSAPPPGSATPLPSGGSNAGMTPPVPVGAGAPPPPPGAGAPPPAGPGAGAPPPPPPGAAPAGPTSPPPSAGGVPLKKPASVQTDPNFPRETPKIDQRMGVLQEEFRSVASDMQNAQTRLQHLQAIGGDPADISKAQKDLAQATQNARDLGIEMNGLQKQAGPRAAPAPVAPAPVAPAPAPAPAPGAPPIASPNAGLTPPVASAPVAGQGSIPQPTQAATGASPVAPAATPTPPPQGYPVAGNNGVRPVGGINEPNLAGQKAQAEEFQKAYGELGKQYSTNSDQAVQQLNTYQEVASVLKKFQESGGKASVVTPYLQKFKSLLSGLGLPMSQDEINQLTEGQVLDKLNFALGSEAAKQINSSRATQLEVKLGTQNSPGITMYPKAAQEWLKFYTAKANLLKRQNDMFTDWRSKFPQADPGQFNSYWSLYNDFPMSVKQRFPVSKISELAQKSGQPPIAVIQALRTKLESINAQQ